MTTGWVGDRGERVVRFAGLGGGFSACQGDSSDLSQLLLPDEGRTPPDATCLSELMKFCQCGGRERKRERDGGVRGRARRGGQQVRGESARHATRRVAYQSRMEKTLLARKCSGSAAAVAHPFSWQRVSERGEEGGRE